MIVYHDDGPPPLSPQLSRDLERLGIRVPDRLRTHAIQRAPGLTPSLTWFGKAQRAAAADGRILRFWRPRNARVGGRALDEPE